MKMGITITKPPEENNFPTLTSGMIENSRFQRNHHNATKLNCCAITQLVLPHDQAIASAQPATTAQRLKVNRGITSIPRNLQLTSSTLGQMHSFKFTRKPPWRPTTIHSCLPSLHQAIGCPADCCDHTYRRSREAPEKPERNKSPNQPGVKCQQAGQQGYAELFARSRSGHDDRGRNYVLMTSNSGAGCGSYTLGFKSLRDQADNHSCCYAVKAMPKKRETLPLLNSHTDDGQARASLEGKTVQTIDHCPLQADRPDLSLTDDVYPLRYVFYIDRRSEAFAVFLNNRSKISSIARDAHCRLYCHLNEKSKRFAASREGVSLGTSESGDGPKSALFYRGQIVCPVTVTAPSMTQLHQFLNHVDARFPSLQAKTHLAEQLVLPVRSANTREH